GKSNRSTCSPSVFSTLLTFNFSSNVFRSSSKSDSSLESSSVFSFTSSFNCLSSSSYSKSSSSNSINVSSSVLQPLNIIREINTTVNSQLLYFIYISPSQSSSVTI